MGSCSLGDDLHVLAVDDSDIDRKFVEKLLKNSSYKVTAVDSGLRALEYLGLGDDQKDSFKCNDSKINLIITDYCMPGMTGYDLLKRIKPLYNQQFQLCKPESATMKEIPVVIMSSENIPTRINKCLEEGAQEFMLKPLQQSDVKRLRCHMKKLSSQCHGRVCLGR